jgi:hypothetical protein
MTYGYAGYAAMIDPGWSDDVLLPEIDVDRLGFRSQAGFPPSVPKLGKRRRSERDLHERRQPLIDEALEPAQRGSFVAGRIGVRE